MCIKDERFAFLINWIIMRNTTTHGIFKGLANMGLMGSTYLGFLFGGTSVHCTPVFWEVSYCTPDFLAIYRQCTSWSPVYPHVCIPNRGRHPCFKIPMHSLFGYSVSQNSVLIAFTFPKKYVRAGLAKLGGPLRFSQIQYLGGWPNSQANQGL